ncbi:MAG: SUMF1/EgtB/PvdO family nonheme iron enzyme [Bacteroidales bacterium]|nr:SUMF1/EgtB/PvdO family nonheme iron enzyme [Bacteroidales bacterium]
MRRLTLTILWAAALVAAWAQKPDKKTAKLEKQLVGTFVEIPGAHFLTHNAEGDTMWVTLAPFRMLETEVTNASYNLFLDDLKAQGRMADYEKAKIDTARTIIVTHYFSHPALPPLPPYPVSCISHEGAMLFCRWLTEKMGGDEWEYTLPTTDQWKHAAHGGLINNTYPIGGPYLTNRNGEPLYNFLRVGDENITKQDGKYVVVINNGPFHLCDNLPDIAKSHYPNNYGLYNMSGNVAEMVYERGIAYGGSYLDPGYDIRIDSEKRYDGPSPLIGFRVIAVRKKH